MTDTIASRVTRVIGGSVHALLDAVENAAPEADHGPGDPRGRPGHRRGPGRARPGRGGQAPRHVEPQQAQYPERDAGRADRDRHGQGRRRRSRGPASPSRSTSTIKFRCCSVRCRTRSVAARSSRATSRRCWPRSARWKSALQDFIAARAAAAASAPARMHRAARPRARSTAPDRPSTACWRARPASPVATSAINPDAAKLRELQDMARTHRIDERLAALKAAQSDRR